MKYTAIISTDEPLTEDIIQALKDTMFFGDDPAYALEIEDIKLEQEPTTKNDLGVDCISRDDAIEVLKDWDGYFIGHSSDDVIKALNLAIKALEHPEKNIVAVVPCGDAVSRAEVLKLMKDNWHTHNGDWAMQESMDDIRALPSVTPQSMS